MAERAATIAGAFCAHVHTLAKVRRAESCGLAVVDECVCARAQRPGVPPATAEAARGVSTESVLSRIHVYRACDLVEQLAVVRVLTSPDSPFFREHPDVRLVVVDSMAFHFRSGSEDMGVRTRQLTTMAQQLLQLAVRRRMAVRGAHALGLAPSHARPRACAQVAVVNHMTTKFAAKGVGAPVGVAEDTKLVPALGARCKSGVESRRSHCPPCARR